MLSTTVRTTKNVDASNALSRATRQYLLDGAQKGYNVSQDHVPHGATSFLANQSAIEPTVLEDGSVYWGYSAKYARAVNDGTAPHWIPVQAVRRSLMPWARRVLGDERAAWAVRQKIAEEGTDAQPFFDRGVKAMRDWFRAKSFGSRFEAELGGP